MAMKNRKVRPVLRFLAEEGGASLIEYAILASLIAAVSVAIVTAIGLKTTAMFVPTTLGLP